MAKIGLNRNVTISTNSTKLICLQSQLHAGRALIFIGVLFAVPASVDPHGGNAWQHMHMESSSKAVCFELFTMSVCVFLAVLPHVHAIHDALAPGKSGWSHAKPSFSLRPISESTKSLSWLYLAIKSCRVNFLKLPRRFWVLVLVMFW